MPDEIIKKILIEMKLLTPSEKGKLFSLFFAQERAQMKGSRKELRDSVKLDRELTDEDIESVLYNPNPDDLIK